MNLSTLFQFTSFVNVNCFYFLKPSGESDTYLNITCGQVSFHWGKKKLMAGKMKREAHCYHRPLRWGEGGPGGSCELIPRQNHFCWGKDLGPGYVREMSRKSPGNSSKLWREYRTFHSPHHGVLSQFYLDLRKQGNLSWLLWGRISIYRKQ